MPGEFLSRLVSAAGPLTDTGFELANTGLLIEVPGFNDLKIRGLSLNILNSRRIRGQSGRPRPATNTGAQPLVPEIEIMLCIAKRG
jgi:hypothetical protein